MKIGTNDIIKMYNGSNEITKAYLGSELIYQNTPPVTIDEHTLRLFHFDEGNYIDVKGIKDSARFGMYQNAYSTQRTTDSSPKFGASCLQDTQDGCLFKNTITSSSDWTIDCWHKFGSGGRYYLGSGQYVSGMTGHGVEFDAGAGKVAIFNGYEGSSYTDSVNYTFQENTWYHLAACRDVTNGKTYGFVNGVKVLEVTDSVANPKNHLIMGGFGYTDELRASDNVRYTADFDVPTAAYSYDTKEHYTLVGGPTVTSDYEISGFDDGKYAYITNPFKFGANATSFELKTAVKLAATSSTETVIFDSFWPDSTTPAQFIRLTKNSSNCVRLRISTDGSAGAGATYAVDIAGSTTIPVDTKFYIKVNFDTTNGYKLYTSTDDSTWVLEGSSAVTTLPYNADYSSTAMKIGSRYYASSNYGYNWNGSIYMEDTYISFDNNFRWDAVKVQSVL